jgi:hypothetical protein
LLHLNVAAKLEALCYDVRYLRRRLRMTRAERLRLQDRFRDMVRAFARAGWRPGHERLPLEDIREGRPQRRGGGPIVRSGFLPEFAEGDGA